MALNKRKRQAVIRFRRYNKDAEPSNWYRAKLMLYFPWYDENMDLLGGYSTYEEHYHHVHSIVHANESVYNAEDVDDIDVSEDGPPVGVRRICGHNIRNNRAKHAQGIIWE